VPNCQGDYEDPDRTVVTDDEAEAEREALRKFYQRERLTTVNRKTVLRNIRKFLFWFAVVAAIIIGCLAL